MTSYEVQLSSKHGESFLNYLVYTLYSDSVYDSGPISFVCNNIIHSRKVDGGRIKRTGVRGFCISASSVKAYSY